MSRENVEIIRVGYEDFRETRDFRTEVMDPEFVWDMSTFRNWPEQRTYPGIAGARQFMSDWLEAWDAWELEVESIQDAGDDKVVSILRQHGRSKATGLAVDMRFAQVWTLREGKQVRMQMYADPAEAFEALGLDPPV
jgi:ketosteroid isomerase-like protein